MAAVNSLLLLLTTLAPNTEPPGNSPFPPSIEWATESFHSNDLPEEQFQGETLPLLDVECVFVHIHNERKCQSFDEWNKTAAQNCLIRTMQLRSSAVVWPCGVGLFSGVEFFCCPKKVEEPRSSTRTVCLPNEEISCFSHCQLNCTNYKRRSHCPMICIEGCVCKLPMIRGPGGNCIMPEQCPNVQHYPQVLNQEDPGYIPCPSDEEVSCFSHCQPNCTNYDKEIACPMYCAVGCVCKLPMIRGPDGKCIMSQQCPRLQSYTTENPISDWEESGEKTSDDSDDNDIYSKMFPTPLSSPNTCPENEEYLECGDVCEKNCREYSRNMPCEYKCEPGCFCKDPMIRGPDGKCIYKEECPESIAKLGDYPTCCKNEEFQFCGTLCPVNCTTYGKEIPCIEMCVQGCFCKEPRIRGPDGKCIFPEECPATSNEPEKAAVDLTLLPDLPKFSCKENEEFSFCASWCPDNCDNYETDALCKHVCRPGCKCKEGYVIGREGICIKKERCEDKISEDCSKFEYYDDCGSQCEEDCYNYNTTDRNCENKGCKKGCFCKPGLVRSPDWKCVLPDSCPLQSQTYWTLRILEKPENAAVDLTFLPDLPKFSCKENAEFSFCASLCPDNCDNYGMDGLCKHVCVPGCKCKEGYVIGREGTCIKKEYCEEKIREDCTEHEYYDDCGSHCEADCYKYNGTDNNCQDKGCKRGCFCKPGLVRSPEWKCVLPDSCPLLPQTNWTVRVLQKRENATLSESYFPDLPILSCAENSEFSFCASLCPDNCDNYETDRICKHLCVPGCKCNEGYVKGRNGTCIRKKYCEKQISEDCTENEHFDDCGSYCEMDCYNYNTDNNCESKRCKEGCFCKPGFVRSPDWKCVLPDNCPPQSKLPLYWALRMWEKRNSSKMQTF